MTHHMMPVANHPDIKALPFCTKSIIAQVMPVKVKSFTTNLTVGMQLVDCFLYLQPVFRRKMVILIPTHTLALYI